MFKQITIATILTSFLVLSMGPLPGASAQSVIDLPAPGTMVDFSPKFNQATLKGIIFHPNNPFRFDFILDEGDAQLNQEESKAQTQKIAAYFLTSLTTPEKEIWVNLSPFEKGRIIPAFFGDTLMGQNLLAQDYMLKQIMATALYPERQLGKEFWQKIYEQAQIKFGTTSIPINTFNKVWIIPDKAVVYENAKMNAVFVAQSSLKVMLEKDYLAENKSGVHVAAVPVLDSVASTMSSAVIKELVIPALEREVNEGKNFAPLRQVYHALILAKWYKDNLKNNIIARGYVDRNKIMGVEGHDKQMVSEIYRQYLKAYKKGVFNYIKEETVPSIEGQDNSGTVIPRKYFSGGFTIWNMRITKGSRAMVAGSLRGDRTFIAKVSLAMTSRQAFGRGTNAQKTSRALIREGRRGLSVLALALQLSSAALAQQSTQKGQPQVIQQTQEELQLQEQLSRTLGIINVNQPPADPVTDPKEKKLLLNKIQDASNNKGDEESAADALARIADTSAVEYAIDGLRLSRPGHFSQDFFSNSTGPNLTDGVSPLVEATTKGIVDSGLELYAFLGERKNAASDRFRLECLKYLIRVAHQLKAERQNPSKYRQLSNLIQRLLKRDLTDSLLRKDPDPTVRALRLVAFAVFVRAGIADMVLGGNAHLGWERVADVFRSPDSDMIEKRAAALALYAPEVNARDNRFRGIVTDYLGQPVGKTTDMIIYEMMLNIAVKQGLPVFPTVMEHLAHFFDNRPADTDTVKLKNWHEHMQLMKRQAMNLARGKDGKINKDLIISNLDRMLDDLNNGQLDIKADATEFTNAFYLDFLFTCVQSGELDPEVFLSQLNILRESNGLEPVKSLNDLHPAGFGDAEHPFGNGEQARKLAVSSLALLRTHRGNASTNLSNVIFYGGSAFFYELERLFAATTDLDTVNAFLADYPYVQKFSGVFPRANAWVVDMDAKAKSEKASIRTAVINYEQSQGFGIGVGSAIASGHREQLMNVLQSPNLSADYIQDIVSAVFSPMYPNPVLEEVQKPEQKKDYFKFLDLVAKKIVESGVDATTLINNAPAQGTTEGNLTKELLLSAVEEARKTQGKTLEAVVEEKASLKWASAGAMLTDYLLRNTNAQPTAAVAQALEDSYNFSRSPLSPNSGYTIIKTIIAQHSHPEDRLRLIGVFDACEDLAFKFEFLGDMFDTKDDKGNRSHAVDVALFHSYESAPIAQKARVVREVIKIYLYWMDHSSVNSKATREAADEIAVDTYLFARQDNFWKKDTAWTTWLEDMLRDGTLGNEELAQGEKVALKMLKSNVESSGEESRASGTNAGNVIPGGNSYDHALDIVLNPKASPDQVRVALANVTKFPPKAVYQLTQILEKVSIYSQAEYKSALEDGIKNAQAHLQPFMEGIDQKQDLANNIIGDFENAPDLMTQVAATERFMTADAPIMGDLFWRAINISQGHYAGFAQNPSIRVQFFKLLAVLRKEIQSFSSTDPAKFNTIMSFLKSKIQQQAAAASLEDRYKIGVPYIFVRSIDPTFTVDLGFHYVKDDHLLYPPAQASVTDIRDNAKEIPRIYGALAISLNRSKSQVEQYNRDPNTGRMRPITDLLTEFENLFDFSPSNAVKQKAAVANLGWVTKLYRNELHPNDAEGLEWLIFNEDHWVNVNDVPQIRPSQEQLAQYNDRERLAASGLRYKIGPSVWERARQDLQSEDKVAHHPGDIAEAINAIKFNGPVSLVTPMLDLYFRHGLNEENEAKHFYNNEAGGMMESFFGSRIRDAIKYMANRENGKYKQEVLELMRQFLAPRSGAKQDARNKLLQHNMNTLMDEITNNKAMVHTVYGGINLENVHLQSQGREEIRTAFDDPAQLAILMKSDGLIAVIENVKPLTPSAINLLLGAI